MTIKEICEASGLTKKAVAYYEFVRMSGKMDTENTAKKMCKRCGKLPVCDFMG